MDFHFSPPALATCTGKAIPEKAYPKLIYIQYLLNKEDTLNQLRSWNCLRKLASQTYNSNRFVIWKILLVGFPKVLPIFKKESKLDHKVNMEIQALIN